MAADSTFSRRWRSLLPNWTLRYSGLSSLPWLRDHFKSVNINHSYKSIYAVGAYQSYSTFESLMGDNLGFITDATSGNPIPNSMFNVSTVSINESFSPLLGIDVTFLNNMTAKARIPPDTCPDAVDDKCAGQRGAEQGLGVWLGIPHQQLQSLQVKDAQNRQEQQRQQAKQQ